MAVKSVRINFILPFKARRPAGGFRVMYEYANRLAKKGYKIHLTYPIDTPYMNYRLPYVARSILFKLEGFRTDQWFQFHPSISMSYVPRVIDEYIPDADVVIATWWATAMEMGKLSDQKGKKINLIQGFENWTGHEELLYASYNMKDTTNIVVASYLKEIVAKYSNSAPIVIHNAIDKEQFYIKDEVSKRNPASVAMTYSVQEIKGSQYGLEALEIVKEKYPELKAEFFGVCPKPDNLPTWISYYRNPPNLCEIYNRNAIFVSNSFTEGFPLTPAESLFCGCALVCTDIDGHKEFAIDNETALLAPIKNPVEIAKRIEYLITNNQQRISLAQQGNAYIQQFEWDDAVGRMMLVINSLLS